MYNTLQTDAAGGRKLPDRLHPVGHLGTVAEVAGATPAAAPLAAASRMSPVAPSSRSLRRGTDDITGEAVDA